MLQGWQGTRLPCRESLSETSPSESDQRQIQESASPAMAVFTLEPEVLDANGNGGTALELQALDNF